MTARALRLGGLLVAVCVTADCFHATIETGRPASPETVDQAWASSWILGLVPPKTVEAAEKCASGVSKVETQLSFLNQLVGFLTLGIYTPMAIKVTCAAGGTAAAPTESPMLFVSTDADETARRQAVSAAAQLSLAEGRPVFLRLPAQEAASR